MDLITERIKIKELSTVHLQQVYQLHSSPLVDEFNTLGIPESIDISKELLNEWIATQHDIPRTKYIFCIELKETNEFIGLIAMNLGKVNYRIAEVWYKLHPEFWGLGYTTEALLALLEFGFLKLGLHRIEAGCAVENIASIRVLEKVGMTREGRKRKILPIRGEWVDNYIYSILETDFMPYTSER